MEMNDKRQSPSTTDSKPRLTSLNDPFFSLPLLFALDVICYALARRRGEEQRQTWAIDHLSLLIEQMIINA